MGAEEGDWSTWTYGRETFGGNMTVNSKVFVLCESDTTAAVI
jgi:hypothetical protein